MEEHKLSKSAVWTVVIIIVLVVTVVVWALLKPAHQESGLSPTVPGVVSESLENSRHQANDAIRIGDLKQIGILLEQYKLDNGSYPIANTLTALDTGVLDSVTALSDMGTIAENGPLGADDDYFYQSDANGTQYVLSMTKEVDGSIYRYPPSTNL